MVITDDTRIKETLPTLKALIARKGATPHSGEPPRPSEGQAATEAVAQAGGRRACELSRSARWFSPMTAWATMPKAKTMAP